MEKEQEVIEYHTYDEVPVILNAKEIASLLHMPILNLMISRYPILLRLFGRSLDLGLSAGRPQ